MTSSEPIEAVPPHEQLAEQSVLGAMLYSANVIAELVPELTGHDFYDPKHQLVFAAICDMFAAGTPVDAVSIVDELNKRDELRRVGGAPYIHTLLRAAASAGSASYHALRIVKPKALQRRLIEAGIRIQQLGYRGGDGTADAAEQILFAATDTGQSGDVVSISELLVPALDRLEAVAEGKNDTGLPTGLPDMDKIIGGLKSGQLIVIAARPSMGKSVLATDIARHVSLKQRLGVLFVSLEMSKDEVTNRILAAEGGIDLGVFNGTKKPTDDDFAKASMAAARLAEADLCIDASADATVLEVRAKARRLAASNHRLGLVIVDYLQLMPSPRRADTREREVAEISRGLKLLAKDISCPVIAVAQLNRNVEARTDKRPMMSDLRESGALEADADIILLLHRDDYYDPESPRSGELDIHIAKNRNGRTDTITTAAQLHKARIVSIA
ncbi:replicative DNA helicase [Stackebrandtia nassauensis]|uniref:Replicative DNA helicase n=1 Tax=Stackebrandtia nassauensis (strain DSM 44728 / CIP 108903 / NRRL B-16338 / NBRC 102104 / LLR-40K-21) TaxID=446470 RepID=D3Q400_STANL|nr:replicative DNA helicase [Stackebrandtia nassauensis]ADD45885.1 replicative DNA helicase [Stackebrandtia nassauensis DSM 44728]